jgi:transcriptional regulator with XRE-family HTH domain
MHSKNDAAGRLGTLLRQRRVSQGRRQDEVAIAAGISVPYLCNLEKGSRDGAAPDKLIRLAEVLGLPVRKVIRAAMDAKVSDLQTALDEYEARSEVRGAA